MPNHDIPTRKVTDPCEILSGARNLLSNPKKWVKKDLARVTVDRKFLFWDRDRIQYCLLGALGQVEYDNPQWGYSVNFEVLETLASVIRDECGQSVDGFPIAATSVIYHFNDAYEIGHDDVLKVLDKAIEVCKGGEHDSDPVRPV